MKTTAEMIEVMQAAERGEAIQCKAVSYSEWGDVHGPVWNWLATDYRIKPREPRVIWVNEYKDGYYGIEYAVHESQEDASGHVTEGVIRTAIKFIEVIE